MAQSRTHRGRKTAPAGSGLPRRSWGRLSKRTPGDARFLIITQGGGSSCRACALRASAWAGEALAEEIVTLERYAG
jgi:hypothetical protein